MRRRLTLSNIVATVALVFAMSGGALAAKHYLLTSTHQISPQVLKALRSRPGPPGEKGTAGTNGIDVTSRQFDGAAGGCTQGGVEFKDVTGTTFACNAKEGNAPKERPDEKWKGEGQPSWPDTLPSGKTETGTWGFVSHAEGPERTPLSFPVPTAMPLQAILGRGPVEVLEPNEEDPIDAHPNCPGTVTNPKADPGFLCVYSERLEAPLSGYGSLRTSGVVLIFESSDSTARVDEGTWAVTAP
jgi:hypothetical protein